MRKLRGDGDLFPFLPQLSMMSLDGRELLYVDSEDMLSCFSLFRMPDSWRGYFAFEKPVSRSAFGGCAHETTLVYMKAVPMGWIGAVDVMQCMARRLVYGTCDVLAASELRKDRDLPREDVSVVCMDGFDYVRRVQQLGEGIMSQDTSSRSARVERFVAVCKELGLPLNSSKALICGLRASLLGGELNGVTGRLSVSHDKSVMMICKALGLASENLVTQASLQHWAGIFCFSAGFRRPLFAVL